MKYHRFLWFSSKTQAMAVGHKCCEKGFKTYFLKASELNDKFTAALQDGQREKIILTSNVEPDKWIDFFSDEKALKSAMDRFFDQCLVISLHGNSYRDSGRRKNRDPRRRPTYNYE